MDDDDSWMRAIAAYGAPPPPSFPSLVLPPKKWFETPTVDIRREAAVAERARIVADLRAIADDVTNPTNKLALLMVALWIEHE